MVYDMDLFRFHSFPVTISFNKRGLLIFSGFKNAMHAY
jgi:hypothetical protein